MGLFDRFKSQEPTQMEAINGRDYFYGKLQNAAMGPQDPYEAELCKRIEGMSQGKVDLYASEFIKVEGFRSNRGLMPFDPKMINLAINYMDKGVNLGAIGMEPDYRSMAIRVDAIKPQVGERSEMDHGADKAVVENVNLGVNVKSSHAEALTPDMMPDHLKDAVGYGGDER